MRNNKLFKMVIFQRKTDKVKQGKFKTYLQANLLKKTEFSLQIIKRRKKKAKDQIHNFKNQIIFAP